MSMRGLTDEKKDEIEAHDVVLNFFLMKLLEEHLISERVFGETKRRLLIEESSSEKSLSDVA